MFMFLYLAGSHGYIYERQKRKYYRTVPAGVTFPKVNHGNTKPICEICSKLTIKTPERRLSIVNFEQISNIVLVFLLLTSNK